MRRLIPAAALVLAALALWFGRGIIAVTDASPNATRIGVLPPLWQLAALILAAAGVASIARPSFARTLPLLFASVLLLPWIPGRVPPAVFVWTGHAALAVWIVVALSMLLATDAGGLAIVTRHRLAGPGRAPLVAFFLASTLYGLGFWRVAPRLVGGDEPHYLIITQSLLNDGDLRIEDNHKRAEYSAYFPGELKPDFWRRGKNGQIYSIHAPGLPALIAPVFALAGYPGVVVFLILMAAAGTALAWKLAYDVTGDAGAAWFGWATIALSAPFLFHAFSIYPDGAAAPIVLTGVWAMMKAPATAQSKPATARSWFLHGLALALLPWMHSRFAVLAGVLGLFVLLRMWGRPGAVRDGSAFLAAPVAGAAAWFWFFYAIYGEPSPSAPYRGATISSVDYITSGIGGLLFDQQFGLVANAPACLIAGAGLVALCRWRVDRRDRSGGPSHARLALELAGLIVFLTTSYLLVVTPMRMWWGGWSAPARFAVPILLPFAIPAAAFWTTARSRATRATAVAALSATVLLTALLIWVDRGRLAYNVRDGYALWLDWLNPLADLSHGLPSFHRGTEASSFWHVTIWGAALIAGWLVLRVIDRGVRSRAAIALATPLCFSLAVMTAITLVWRSNGVPGLTPTPAELELLRHADPQRSAVGLIYDPPRRIAIEHVPARLRIDTSERYLGTRDRPLFVLPVIPAGSYLVHLRFASPPEGTINVGIGREWFPIWNFSLKEQPQGKSAVRLDFPVEVRALIIRGDEEARRSIAGINVEPLALSAEELRRPGSGYAIQAVRYGGGTVYFLDEGAFPEPNAFWVRGGRRAETVIVPAARRPTTSLFLRNAPVENRLTLESGKWRRELALEPGQELSVDIPIEHTPSAATAVRFETTNGFRPAVVDRSSTDFRFLGVWVELR